MEQNQRFLFRAAVKTFVSARPDNSTAIDKDMTGVFACCKAAAKFVFVLACVSGRGGLFFPPRYSLRAVGFLFRSMAEFYSPKTKPGVN